MPIILLALGILVASAGIGAIEFGILVNEFSLRSALISAGTTALTGGLILVALVAVISELKRLGKSLEARPPARSVRPSADDVSEPSIALASVVASPDPSSRSASAQVSFRPRPDTEGHLMAVESRLPLYSAVDASAAATERLRWMIPRTDRADPKPSIVAMADEVPLSPNGSGQQSGEMRTPAAETVLEAKLEDEVDAADTIAVKTSPLEFLFPRPAPPAPNKKFGDVWRIDRQPVKNVLDAEKSAEPASYGEPAPSAVAILKSGVVNGMGYTVYANGAIEAELPQGMVRFSSIAELRAHIESNFLPDDRRRMSEERGAI
jgi:hypothetical protein